MKDRNRSKKSLFQISKVLWHLDIFRRSFRELSGHTCMVESCIFCALKELFSQLQLSHESALPPDALRRALAQSLFDQQRFHLGFMDDAAECFENILVRIHYHLTGVECEDLCSTKHCIPHVKFAMTLVEQSVCGACGATSEPLPFTQMVHYVSASALISQAKQPTGAPDEDLFGQLLKKAGGMGDIRDCPSLCGAKIQIRRTLTNLPEVVSVGIVWDSERPSLQQVTSLLDVLRTSVRLSHVFHTPAPSTKTHDLVALVTYYGKHYSTFFFHTKLRIWIYFDDANVREVGPKWEQVVEKCSRGRYQPLLLLFAMSDGTPVDTSTAPTKVIVSNACPVSPTMNGSPGQVSLGLINKPALPQQGLPGPPGPARRSLTPSPEKPSLSSQMQRRALTPNPDQNSQRSLGVGDYQNLSIFQGEIGGRGGWRTDLVRRDSGNWSGDRNSASSSSSTSLENPYQYIISRMQHRTSTLMRSPSSSGKGNGGESSSGGSQCDAGYDSYSLSSTDSLPLQQSLKHNLQLAKIPEGHHSPIGIGIKAPQKPLEHADCEKLCEEADLLLYHSQATDDLQTALSFANAAVEKARQAMDAPYSNPGAASAARMKHNACLMQARSIYKKIEDSNGTRHAEGRHSRQSSKDKGNHSRQNSKELLPNLLPPPEKQPEPAAPPAPEKNIEIYATLPKSRKGLLSRAAKVKNVVEDEEYLMYDRPGRSLNRTKPQTGKKEEKRARSEDRSNKTQKDVVSNQLAKEAKKQTKPEEVKQGKKQHKIRRKLLMGGLIKRKNRSLPDLRDDEVITKGASKDDSTLVKSDKQSSLSGYLSEGHLEYSGNPNLEKSKLMRKSVHGSKLMQLAKVPPPPPLRTSSTLSKFDRLPFPLPGEEFKHYDNEGWNQEPQSLPPMNHYSDDPGGSVVNYAVGGYLLQQNCNTKLVTTAQVHHVSSPVMNDEDDDFQLPPYPSPLGSVSHSRQASEDFPPPPPEEQPVNSSSLLEQLQKKRLQILSDSNSGGSKSKDCTDSGASKESSSDTWLKELQAKQASLREKSMTDLDKITSLDKISPKQVVAESSRNVDSIHLADEPVSSVKDLKSRFENISVKGIDKPLKISNDSSHRTLTSSMAIPVVSNIVKQEKLDSITPAPIKELKSNLVKPNDNKNAYQNGIMDDPNRRHKKKSVTFCEQVVLVATAEEDKVDSYIPNPILERVLRSVLHKDSPQEVREVTVQSVVPLKRNDSGNYGQCGQRNQEQKINNPDELRNGETSLHHLPINDPSAINKTAIPLRAQPSPILNRQPMRLQPSPMNTPAPQSNVMSPQCPMIPSSDTRLSSLSPSYPNGIDNSSHSLRNQYYATQDPIHNGTPYSPSALDGNIINPSINDSGSQQSAMNTSEIYTRYKSMGGDQSAPGNGPIIGNQTYGRPPLPSGTINMNGSVQQSSCYPYTTANLAALHSQIHSQNPNSPVYHHINGIKQNAAHSNSSNQNGTVPGVVMSPNQNGIPHSMNGMSPNSVSLGQPSHHHSDNQTSSPNSSVHFGNRCSPQTYLQRPPSSGSLSSCYQSPPVSLPYSQQMMQQAMLQQNQRQHNGNGLIAGNSNSSPHMATTHQPRIIQGSSAQIPNPLSLRQRVGSPNHFTQGHLNYVQKPQYITDTPQSGDVHLNAPSAHHTQNHINNGASMPQYNSPVTSGESTPHHQQPVQNGPTSGHTVSISRSLSNSSQHSNQSNSNMHYNLHSPDPTKPHYSPYLTPPMPVSTNRSCYMSVPQKKVSEEMRRGRPQGVYQQDPESNGTSLQRPDIYQRVPNPEHFQQSPSQYNPYITPPQPANYQAKYSPYQHPPMPKQEPTKPSPPSSAPFRTASCNLCRKKQVNPPAMYCPDCDFYMSRFKPKS